MFLYCEHRNRIYSTFDRTIVASDSLRTNLETGELDVNHDREEYVHSTTYSCFECSDGDNLLHEQQDRFKIVWYQVVTMTKDRREVISMFEEDETNVKSNLEYIDLGKLTAEQLLIVKEVFDI